MSANPRMRSPNWRTRAVAATAREVQVQRFRVEVVSGPNRGQIGAAEGTELAIGTAPGNHLVVTDPTVSRHHAVITATTNGFQVRDLGSTNGTCLAGYRVESAYLESGALVQLGETTVRFDALEERVTHPSASSTGSATSSGRARPCGGCSASSSESRRATPPSCSTARPAPAKAPSPRRSTS